MQSTTFYNICTAGYVIALMLYIANLALKKAKVRRAATITVAASFMTQVAGMIVRWHEAGLVELEAAERATGLHLEGLTRFVVYTQHPPWSNLYEIMVYMSWGVVFVFLISEVKFRIRFTGIIALLIALLALGLASLTPDRGAIKPLVPALQSWWIMIHVISSAIGYAAGTMGAIASFLFLLKAKNRVSLSSVAAGVMAISLVLFMVLGRGLQLFTTGQYKVKLLKEMGHQLVPAGRMAGNSFAPLYVASPNVGALMLLSMALCVVAFVLLVMRRSDDVPRGKHLTVLGLAFGATTATVALILINAFTQRDVQVAAEMAKTLMPQGPWRLALESNQWDMALFGIVWAAQAALFLAVLFPDALRRALPDAARLDRAAYYAIMVSFALVAVVLVTGALWAHYAWGRYWGWDPKETGALVIWIVYAMYLHGRVTHGWVGVPAAVIGCLGFFVILAGFLGVNLGWFADGLHNYGSA
jgi:ABC-type transport system involved in cytochrome c biogenesis permease subunit